MLKSIDILLGFSVIMLAISMSVTLIIQWILQVSQMRGKKLEEGIASLLHQIDPQILTNEISTQIANRILTHPMLARSGRKLAEVVQREELIKIVLEIAACGKPAQPVVATAAATAGASGAGGSITPQAVAPQPPDQLAAILADALAKAGIANPGQTLDAVRMLSMQLEASRPGDGGARARGGGSNRRGGEPVRGQDQQLVRRHHGSREPELHQLLAAVDHRGIVRGRAAAATRCVEHREPAGNRRHATGIARGCGAPDRLHGEPAGAGCR